MNCRPHCGACCIALSISSPIPGMPAGKPAGVLGVSIGQIGTALAQQHLRNILAYLDVPTLGQPEVFLRADAALDAAGALKPDTRDFLRGWMERYVAWIKQHAR